MFLIILGLVILFAVGALVGATVRSNGYSLSQWNGLVASAAVLIYLAILVAGGKGTAWPLLTSLTLVVSYALGLVFFWNQTPLQDAEFTTPVYERNPEWVMPNPLRLTEPLDILEDYEYQPGDLHNSHA